MILIKNAKIDTMKTSRIEKGCLAIKQGKIAYVGEDEAQAKAALQENTKDSFVEMDMKGMYVLPGLVEPHCHVGLWEDGQGMEGSDGNETTDPITPHLQGIDGVYHADRNFVEAREAGVTTLVTGPGSANVLGGQFAALKTTGRYVDEMILKNPATMKTAFGENPKAVYTEKSQTPNTRMATAALLREALEKTKEYKEKWDKHRQNPQEHDKPDVDVKLEAMLPVLERKLLLKAHAHRADDIMTAVRIAEEYNLDMTVEHCTEGHLIADVLKEKNVRPILGPLMLERSKPELRNTDIKAPGILSAAGIKIAIMTDHPCLPIQYLLLSAAMAHKEGMGAKEALEAITINAAEFCGIDDRVGSLEVGKDADVVVFDKEPLDFTTKVQYTIINGEIVFDAKG